MSLLGLAFSVLIVTNFIIPSVLNGYNPLIVSLIGAILITIVSMDLAHGFKKWTTVSIASVLITLLIASNIGSIFVNFASLIGMGSEESVWLQMGPYGYINLKGLILGGIIIATLGVLDDVTSTQTAAVKEISEADKSLGFKELYKRAFKVGKEHITSMVNTLVLAYVGASLPMILLYSTDSSRPFWLILNSEMITEEIIRSIVGSIALTLAVPISTFLAAYWFSTYRKSKFNSKK